MSKSNPYDLPPPWNPGYAMPDNVVDEGLERRAYTTAWAPRGSFDNPKVGTAGYAVPQYVKDEGYGVGAMVTRWAQRGTYAGPAVPHWLDRKSAEIVGTEKLPGGATKMTIATMSGVEERVAGEAQFTEYGIKSARALIATVRMMPPKIRVEQIRKALDKIDPKLYGRAKDFADKEAKAGVPADVALERGIAAAMSVGLASELVDLGKGKAPARKSQLGAVCYGCALLGATELAKTSLLSTALASQLKSMTTSVLTSADSTPTKDGYCWVPANGSVPGHWERLAAGQVCGSTAPGPGPTVRDNRDNTTSGGGVVVTGSDGSAVQTTVTSAPVTPPDQKFLQIGPFLIPVNAGEWRDHRALVDDRKAYVDQNIALAARAGGVSTSELKTGKYPFVKFQANGGESWGLFYQEKSDGSRIIAYHKVAPEMMGNIIGDIGGAIKDAAEYVGGAIASVFKKIWAGIKWVAAKVVDFIGDAAEWIKDKACDLFTSPVGNLAGAAAGAAIGGPAGAQAGAIGAQVAGAACTPTPAPGTGGGQPATEESSMLPILLIGGAGLAAVLLPGKKK